jgi:hypothetical protein
MPDVTFGIVNVVLVPTRLLFGSYQLKEVNGDGSTISKIIVEPTHSGALEVISGAG